LIFSVSTSTPTALATPGVCCSVASCCSSMALESVSATPFCATVKSALPTEMMAAADCSSPLLVTASVTTAITAMATANAKPIERAFFDQRFRRMRPKKVTSWWPGPSHFDAGQS